ncbi:hypothetical protein [Streptomyces sp. NPDC007083]|uniref:hypothetical protein n=1 Tax=Streptomyces sp. NPDC007083 TaxID=3156913 RepID=UPI0033C85316
MTDPMRRRRLLALCAVLGGVLILLAGLVVAGYRMDRDQETKALTDGCKGVLARPQARAILGDGPYKDDPDESRDEGRPGDTKHTLKVRCTVFGGEVALTTHIDAVPSHGHQGSSDGLYPRTRTQLPPQPLGSGWQGIFAVNDTLSYKSPQPLIAILLECRRLREDLLVTVAADLDDADMPLDDPRIRARFARFATATAERANARWKCGAAVGDLPKDVALPPGRDDYVPLQAARGTCAHLPGQGPNASLAWEGHTDSEGATAPLEQCVLGRTAPLATPAYELRAHYGPYAEEVRAQSRADSIHSDEKNPANADAGRRHWVSGFWASASCPETSERALYTIQRSGPSGNDPPRGKEQRKAETYEKSALKAFAERSAKRHGCTPPVLP